VADLFGDQPVSLQDMLGCARREVEMRERVYPRWVALSKMTQERSIQELRFMRAIVRYLEAQIRSG
jgi:hypothetical protein